MAVRACEAVGAVAGGSCGCVCGPVVVVCFGCGLSRRAGVRLSASAVVCPVVSVSGVVLSWVEILEHGPSGSVACRLRSCVPGSAEKSAPQPRLEGRLGPGRPAGQPEITYETGWRSRLERLSVTIEKTHSKICSAPDPKDASPPRAAFGSGS